MAVTFLLRGFGILLLILLSFHVLCRRRAGLHVKAGFRTVDVSITRPTNPGLKPAQPSRVDFLPEVPIVGRRPTAISRLSVTGVGESFAGQAGPIHVFLVIREFAVFSISYSRQMAVRMFDIISLRYSCPCGEAAASASGCSRQPRFSRPSRGRMSGRYLVKNSTCSGLK